MYNESEENPEGFFEAPTPHTVPAAVRPASQTWYVMNDVSNERYRQEAKWGEQNHPDTLTPAEDPVTFAPLPAGLVIQIPDQAWYLSKLEAAKAANDIRNAAGQASWDLILLEEVLEALTASDTLDLRAELVQVAAVVIAWIEALDRRTGSVPQFILDLQRGGTNA